MTLQEIEKALFTLDFGKTYDEPKIGVPMPYHKEEGKWQVLTYKHPARHERVKISIIEGKMAVQADCGKKQRTAWKNLHNIEELKQHFKL